MDELAQEFHRLLDRARAGCDEAARQLVERFSKPMLLVIRRRLRQPLRTAFDSTDFLQDAWRSFFRTALQEKTFTDPRQFVAFLSALCLNKLRMAERSQLLTAKRDRRREVPLASLADGPSGALVDPRPTPEAQARAADSWAGFLTSLTETERQGVCLMRERRSQQEIADRLGVSLHTVAQLVQRVKHALDARPQG